MPSLAQVLARPSAFSSAGERSSRLLGGDMPPQNPNFAVTGIAHLQGESICRAPQRARPFAPVTKSCPAATPPNPLPEPIIIQAGSGMEQVSQFLPIEIANKNMAGQQYILMWGHVEYRDGFPDTPLHFED